MLETDIQTIQTIEPDLQTENVFMVKEETQPIESETFQQYLRKIPSMFQDYIDTYSKENREVTIPYKAEVLYLFQAHHLADPNTRLVRGDNLPSIYQTIEDFVKQGHKDVWISVAIPFGENNPDTKEKNRFSTPLFRKDPSTGVYLDKKQDQPKTLEQYLYENATSFVKIFPQDGKDQSNLSLVIGTQDFALKLKVNSHTTREISTHPHEEFFLSGVTSPVNPNELIIFTDNPSDVQVLYPLINSFKYFLRFDTLITSKFPTLKTMNPELMIHIPENDMRNIKKSKVQFLIDFISGYTDHKESQAMSAGKLISQFPAARILPTSYKTTVESMNIIFDYLSETSQGNPPNQGDLPVIAFNQEVLLNSIADFGNTYAYLTYLSGLINRTQLHVGSDTTFTSTGKHLNVLYQQEQPPTELIAQTHATFKKTINSYPTVRDILNLK